MARPSFWVVTLALGFSFLIAKGVLSPSPAPLPVLGTLADFSLTAQDGEEYGSRDLRGEVWMAGFIFTRCPTICPAITTTMGRIQTKAADIGSDFRMISFSVDPGFDKPEVLADYANLYNVNPNRWKFLTGSLDDIKATVVSGLKIGMGEPEGDQDFASIFHGTHFVLVDRQMQIRAYHDSSQPEVVDNLLRDAAMLLNSGD